MCLLDQTGKLLSMTNESQGAWSSSDGKTSKRKSASVLPLLQRCLLPSFLRMSENANVSMAFITFRLWETAEPVWQQSHEKSPCSENWYCVKISVLFLNKNKHIERQMPRSGQFWLANGNDFQTIQLPKTCWTNKSCGYNCQFWVFN